MLTHRQHFRPSRRSSTTSARTSRGRIRPVAELMESRTLLSITVNTFGDVVDAGDGLTSLREAIALAAGTPGADSITLPHQIDSVEGTYALTLGELDLSDPDPLSIQSDGGPATINAQGASRVFSIAAGSVVALEGLVITGGSAPDPNTGSGGGIANDGTATITDCTFSGNSAGFVGGGLYNSGLAAATVSDCDFEGNTSTYGAGFNNQGAATVTGGVFRNNTASGNSGGLDNIGTVSVYGTLFEANSAASYGGAVNVYGGFVGSPGTTLLQGCTFRNNTSNYVAGGVQISETTGTVIDCIFEGNSAQFGGGLSNSGTTTITGGAFRNNTASGNGAGIESIGTVTIIGTLVEQNTSSGYGGGVHAYGGFAGSPGVLTITDATIRGNSAQYGGGVSFEEDQASITGTQITENSATYGGGVYNRDGDWSMDSSAVEFNTAVYVGGGLLNDGNGNATISGSSFANNTAQYGAGGGIFNAYGDSMTVTDVTVAGNVASNGGGISNFGTILVEQSTLSGNTGLYGGGGIFNSSGTVVATGITLDSNSAPGNGGGGLYSSDGAVTATDSTFNANSAGSYGGGVYISGGTATIESSKLSNNTAAVSGGGIFTIGFGGLTIAANLITDNLGGGIDVQSYDTLVQSNTIINNTGDGVRIDGASNNTIGTPDAGNTITGNTGAGVSVVGYAFDNAIRGNVINSNGGPAIDLGGDGRTVNDTGDTDSGPNYLLNFPVISGFATGRHDACHRHIGELAQPQHHLHNRLLCRLGDRACQPRREPPLSWLVPGDHGRTRQRDVRRQSGCGHRPGGNRHGHSHRHVREHLGILRPELHQGNANLRAVYNGVARQGQFQRGADLSSDRQCDDLLEQFQPGRGHPLDILAHLQARKMERPAGGNRHRGGRLDRRRCDRLHDRHGPRDQRRSHLQRHGW